MSIKDKIVEIIDPSVKWRRIADESEALASESASPGSAEAKGAQTTKTPEQGPGGVKQYSAPELLPRSQGGQPIWKEWNSQAASKRGLKVSTWVYTCIAKLAKSVAAAHWVAVREKPDGTLEPAPNAKIEALLNNPNPSYSRQTFFEEMTYHLYLSGNALLSKVRVRGEPVELWPINPAYVKPIPGTTSGNFIDAYLYERGEIERRYDPADMVHLLFTDPDQPYWGMSPMQAAARAIDTEIEAVNWNKIAMQNRAISDGVFSFTEAMTKEQWELAREQVRDQHQGADNAREPWVLGGGAKWNQMSLSPVEMDFIESRKINREEICAIFFTPPPVVGIYDNATLNNVETARLIYWEDTIIPLLEDLKSSLNMALSDELEPGTFIQYDVSHISVLLEVLLKKVKIALDLWAMGVPFSEINRRLGMDIRPFMGDSVGFLPATVMPAGIAAVDTFDDGE